MKKISNKNEKIAASIVELEQNHQMTYEDKVKAIMYISKNLSITDLLEIDNYIQEKKLLTK